MSGHLDAPIPEQSRKIEQNRKVYERRCTLYKDGCIIGRMITGRRSKRKSEIYRKPA